MIKIKNLSDNAKLFALMMATMGIAFFLGSLGTILYDRTLVPIIFICFLAAFVLAAGLQRVMPSSNGHSSRSGSFGNVDLLQQLMENIDDNIFFKDSESKFIMISQANAKWFGLKDPRDVVGMDDFDFFTKEHALKQREEELQIMATGQPVIAEEQATSREGYTGWGSVTKIPLRDKHGNIMGTMGIGRDITELKDKELQLREAEGASEAKSRFLATMSHEIRTPLNGVVGMLKLLRRSQLNNKQQRYVNNGILSADALLTVINDILDYSKIEAGKMEISQLPFNLVEITENVVQMFAQQAEEKNLEIACFIDESVPRVCIGDANRIGQVLINLIGNALKFTSEGDVIVRVRLENEEEEQVVVQFDIADTGIGIAAEKVEHIFEHFMQEDSSTTRRFGGSGLGLSISKQLLELMGGNIQVESTLGQGSTFSFTIPFGKVADVDVPKPLTGIRGLNALVVDDHEINREIICYELKTWGFNTGEAGHGEAALELMRSRAGSGQPFDFAIIDWNMPGMNGEELCRQIKADPQLADTPLILLSSVRGIQPHRLQEIGLSSWLAKPARQSELLDTVMNAINHVETDVQVAESALPETRSVRILLAEDNEINQEVALEILQASGFSCDIVANGKEAVDAAEENDYDLIFMDCMMPEMDGYEATRTIRRNEKATGRRMPIVALTANAMKGDRELCLESGMDDYLSKPLDPDEVVAMIGKWYVDSDVEDKPAFVTECDLQDNEVFVMFDREAVLKRCMGNDALVEKLIAKFFGQVGEDLQALGSALSDSDTAMLVQSAHRIKGAASNLSMDSLREIAAGIERNGRDGNITAAADGFQRLSAEIIRIQKYLSSDQAA
jgi:PAS domain S-box-containing protein